MSQKQTQRAPACVGDAVGLSIPEFADPGVVDKLLPLDVAVLLVAIILDLTALLTLNAHTAIAAVRGFHDHFTLVLVGFEVLGNIVSLG